MKALEAERFMSLKKKELCTHFHIGGKNMQTILTFKGHLSPDKNVKHIKYMAIEPVNKHFLSLLNLLL